MTKTKSKFLILDLTIHEHGEEPIAEGGEFLLQPSLPPLRFVEPGTKGLKVPGVGILFRCRNVIVRSAPPRN
jgi:hypothetical protein